MATIRCPHCGASNQDVTEQDACWKCGKILNAPAEAAPVQTSAPDTTAGSANLSAAPQVETRTPPAPVESNAPATPPPAPIQKTSPARPIIPLIVFLLILILIGIIVLALRR
ncbi:MAG TPA: hypothetical protein VFA07_11905 [Chthonomonadaceae bacterium]|nr:hypothetical protein [Chthonomonadaceae bacterium]